MGKNAQSSPDRRSQAMTANAIKSLPPDLTVSERGEALKDHGGALHFGGMTIIGIREPI
jgi:hypothetical protein